MHDFSERTYMMEPMESTDRDCVVYLKNVIDDPDITVGVHTYYHDIFKDPRDFMKNNILYHFPTFHRQKIQIGSYCSIANGIKFIGPLACHKTDVVSTYPFALAREYWELGPEYFTAGGVSDAPKKGPTIIGNDVWIGFETIIMPGVKIGDGAVIGSRSIVTRDIEPYTIAAGAPARPIRKRFDDDAIEKLLALKWWDLPEELVASLIPTLVEEKDINKTIEAIVVQRIVYEVLKKLGKY